MAEATTAVNTGNSNGPSNSNGPGNSNGNGNNSNNTDTEIVAVVDCGDDDGDDGCCGDPGASLLRLGSGDVIVVSIERCELSAAKYQALAEQTAAKFKAAFPSNRILVIPDTTTYKVVKQPEVIS